MLEIHIDSFSFLENIKNKYKYCIYKFSAKWCSSCKKINLNFLKDISLTDCIFINVDYDKYILDQDFKDYIEIDKLPTIICIENNSKKEIFKYVGTNNEIIKNLILNLNSCDLDF